MFNELLSHYYNKPPAIHLIEDYNIDEYELHYYLLRCMPANSSKYLVILKNGYEYPDFVVKSVELLKENAGVTVTGWHVLNSAKSITGKDVLNNVKAAHSLNELLYEPDVDIDSYSYALVDAILDFDLKVYGNRD